MKKIGPKKQPTPTAAKTKPRVCDPSPRVCILGISLYLTCRMSAAPHTSAPENLMKHSTPTCLQKACQVSSCIPHEDLWRQITTCQSWYYEWSSQQNCLSITASTERTPHTTDAHQEMNISLQTESRYMSMLGGVMHTVLDQQHPHLHI